MASTTAFDAVSRGPNPLEAIFFKPYRISDGVFLFYRQVKDAMIGLPCQNVVAIFPADGNKHLRQTETGRKNDGKK
ncbi:MAG TPA: hypothetical protein VMY59_07775 [Candidatus Thermoplasmatota archaeon]|nr:hypothetical protein [Candidatus Thermoplasmatota archaeon]